jgi:hypothetical protein
MTRSLTTVAVLCTAGLAVTAHAQFVGPSAGGQTPYVVPTAPGVITRSLISNQTNATYNGMPLAPVDYANLDDPNARFELQGIPDGMGQFDNGDGTFTLLVNHELGATQGNVRSHGGTGASISQWKINKATGAVLGGRDLIRSYQADPLNNASTAVTNFGRFCSADLAAQSAYQFQGFGTSERIFTTGEEIGSEGRGTATVVSTGRTYNLPHTGKFSWENAVSSPFAQRKTIMAGLDDSGDGQVYFYVGEKKATGTGANPIDDAGLVGGNLLGLRIPALNNNSNSGTTNRESGAVAASSFSGTRFEMHNFGDVSSITGAALEAASDTNQVTQFARAEDGAWNPNSPNQFFFVTTSSSRLFRATFDDITNPAAGGRIDVMFDNATQSNDAPQSSDNITVVNGLDGKTHVLIQEDGGTGTDDIWLYTVEDNSLLKVATHDSGYSFAAGAESSGIIPAFDTLGMGWFIINTQAGGTATNPANVTGGQVMTLFIPQVIPAPGAIALLGMGGALAGRRRRTR